MDIYKTFDHIFCNFYYNALLWLAVHMHFIFVRWSYMLNVTRKFSAHNEINKLLQFHWIILSAVEYTRLKTNTVDIICQQWKQHIDKVYKSETS